MLRILSLVSIALMTVSLTATPAQADEAERLAATCVRAMNAAVDKHQDAVQGITTRTVRAINALDDEGAPDRAIVAAGHRGAKAVNQSCRRASARVRGLQNRCVRALRRLDAPRELIARVTGAARHALGSIKESGDRAKGIIRHAVAEALE